MTLPCERYNAVTRTEEFLKDLLDPKKASYSLLTHMFAQLLGLKVGDFIWTGGDCHIYKNHFEQVKQQIIREPRKGPTLLMPKFTDLEELKNTTPGQYELLNYDPMLSIKAPMAV